MSSHIKLNNSRIRNRWPLAREGLPFIAISCGVTFLFYYLGLWFLTIFACVLSIFIIFFFRDPERKNVINNQAILSPADGRILEIKNIQGDENQASTPSVKISIFMSVFNVHVNRIPIKSAIKKITYHHGKFFSANLDKASRYNEKNRVVLETSDSRTIILTQIAGLIARRISCWIKEGDRVDAGQRFGLIRFGSRVELYLPGDSQVIVQPCQKVRAGETVIGYLP